ncbi:hypothetical protein SLEP1_g43987 [Rubroshorea leprosula]|uniref:Uncharacterized protein n=1 Tax=Rubroshorea leprosula TaxID=152421 RepID=A0AAV5LFP0_9ROSI|nr:hypothetical protein SLEP1_g43987 [Rubroshorea leprosula]
MSSEEMLSVGGSEEVRALEYGDVDMTSESFDLERTEEGVGGSEMAGVQGEGVPVIVLEVGGRNERCYDFEADIVFEVKEYESELRTRDSLGYLRETYEISSRVLIKPVAMEERACSAPRDHWMLMYAHYLAAGCRFPIAELLMGLLLDYSIGLTQLAPNAMRCEQLQKEKDELEKKNKEMQETLDEVVPAVKQLQDEKDSLSTKLVFEERKRKISKNECNAQEKEIKKMKEAKVELKKNMELLVHNAIEKHIVEFLKSGKFDEKVNLYWLPTTILAFTDCRKKVKSQYPKVDVMSITFGEQEKGVKDNGESIGRRGCRGRGYRRGRDPATSSSGSAYNSVRRGPANSFKSGIATSSC